MKDFKGLIDVTKAKLLIAENTKNSSDTKYFKGVLAVLNKMQEWLEIGKGEKAD